jgi:uncharacterized radical SAM protein YgiQ
MMDKKLDLKLFLPTTKKEMKIRGWDELDIILFGGDAYIDHPSFGLAVIGRVLEAQGYKVGIVPQPNWKDDLRDFKKLGKPRLFFGVTAGSMDSMVNHYTANKRLRSTDAYTPDARAKARPDYASVVYSKILKEIFPEVPLVLGGVEASLRRFTHYDYWADELKPSIMEETGADLLVYGMGEKPIIEVAKRLDSGEPIETITDVLQTAVFDDKRELEGISLHSHEECLESKKLFAENFKHIETESNKYSANFIFQTVKNRRLVVNPPYEVMEEKELDAIYDLPYTRLPHPKYLKKGAIPAYEMIKHSINVHRGCFGACSFCTISAHQGKFVTSRSVKSIRKEVEKVSDMDDFKGHLSDVGGPSANMYRMKGKDLDICKKCKRASCIYPAVCSNLDNNHARILDMYRVVEKVPGVKKVNIGSGIRYDMIFRDKFNKPQSLKYLEEVIHKHVSGRLKVAPEHVSDKVLKFMRKPSFSFYHELNEFFKQINQKYNLRQQLIPYFISSHPNSTTDDMLSLAAETKTLGLNLEQVQDFTPTPMTLSTVIYYSGYNPYTMEKVYTAKNQEEKRAQRKYFFWYKPEFKNDILNELKSKKMFGIIDKLFGKKGFKTESKKQKTEKGGGRNDRLKRETNFENSKSKKSNKGNHSSSNFSKQNTKDFRGKNKFSGKPKKKGR